MFRKIAATLIFLAVVTAAAFGAKTVFIDGTPAQGIKGTKVTAEFLNKTSYNVPTGEDLEGSAPNLYGADTGAANAYVVNLTQGKKRATGTNTSTTTNKLIDSGATFQTAAVVVSDVVLNVTDKTSATVSAIDSQTQLALSSNIFTATSKAYAVGPNIQQLPQAYTTGLAISFKATNANTGASTVNVNNLGVKTIKKNGNADITAGEIVAEQMVAISYDGTYFQLMNRSNTSINPVVNTTPVSGSDARLAWGWNPAIREAVVGKSAVQSIINTTPTPITFDVEDRDTDNIHDNVTNNSRLTVPSGITKVRLRGQIEFAANATGGRYGQITKNCASFTRGPFTGFAAFPSGTVNTTVPVQSQLLDVAAGDYFEFLAYQSSGGALNVNNTFTWFELELIE